MSSDYELMIKRRHEETGGKFGVLIKLDGSQAGYPFWSRGYQGCERCHGSAYRTPQRRWFAIREGDTVRSGWMCA